MNDIKPQRGQVRENEIILKDMDTWLHFTRPYRVVSVHVLNDVLPALREIEDLTRGNGWYAAGFISYEAAPAFESALRVGDQTSLYDELAWSRSSMGTQESDFPYLWFGLYPEPQAVTLPGNRSPGQVPKWLPTVERDAYTSRIERIKKYIARGRTYQVNYTMRLAADFEADPWDFFLQFAQRQNRHAAYVDTGRHVICSASPELFFQLDGNFITCRPMKGTTRRGRTTTEDRERARWLKSSEKNRAENIMIVDMIRNDLGRIAETGSVRVPELFQTERYPTLWQLTSTVTATTSAPVADIFAALFPCASITGAPKVSTMKIIAELESTPRKIYTGSIGYLSPEREARFSVAIRTVLVDREQHKAEFGVGGGIVWDSTSADEYAEALLKARVLTDPDPPFSLLETMLWTPEAGFLLHEQHLARMMDSAHYFDIPVTRERLELYLEQISGDFRAPQRVRVLLGQAGNLSFESNPHDCANSPATLTASLARQPVDSRDIFLYHKTTHRAVYESALEGCLEFEDVLLYNEWHELTEFTLGNLVVELDGRLFTPPVDCGLLAGTFRAHLLETGQVHERKILVEELRTCTQVFRVNSVRRWQTVALHHELRKVP